MKFPALGYFHCIYFCISLLSGFSSASGDAGTENFPFWDPNLPIEQRLDDLMRRLTLKEMVGQMANGGGDPDIPAPAIERLGIPPFNFDTECLRGVVNMNSTSFPMPIGLAATFRYFKDHF